MEISTNCIVPFYGQKVEFQCGYDQTGHLLGEGKILDLEGNLLCEGTFVAAPNDGKKSVSILKFGFFYFDGEIHEISNFDGVNGCGAVIRAFTALTPTFDIQVGLFENGLLNGLGVAIDCVATMSKGEFKDEKLVKGTRITGQGSDHEIKEVFDCYDYEKGIATGSIEYPDEICKGEFQFNGLLTTIHGTLESSVHDGDRWEGDFYYGNNGWVLINGKGKWDGFEGEVTNKKPVNAQGVLHDFDSIWDDVYYYGTWTNGIFNGVWHGHLEYPKNCPNCGNKLGLFSEGKCENCGHSTSESSHCKRFENGKIIEEWDECKDS